MKAFVESQFGYCPLISMFQGRILNNKINKLHERALRLVYKNETLSFDKLLDLDNLLQYITEMSKNLPSKSFTIYHRNVQKPAIEIFYYTSQKCPKTCHRNLLLYITEMSKNLPSKSFTIHHRNVQKPAIEMYKVQKSLSPAFMQSIFPALNNSYDLRSESAFKT